MIACDTLADNEQVFSYVREGREHYHFAVTRMLAWCLQTEREPVAVELSDHLVEAVSRDNGIETEHVERLVRSGTLKGAALMVSWANGTHTCVDGNHRIVAARRLGHTHAPTFILDPDEWRPFLVDLTDINGSPNRAGMMRLIGRMSVGMRGP